MNRLRKSKLLRELPPLALLLMGTLLAAFSYSLFQVPYKIAAGGVGGIAIIINNFTNWPIGTMILVMNLPLWVLGYFYLGRWRFLGRTIVAVVVFSAGVDFFSAYLPNILDTFPITDNILLSAIYGGIVGGIGGGLVYRGGGTLGGTSVTGRIIQMKTGIPLSQVYFYTDGIIVITAGLVFGWEVALYALLTLFLNGLASDYTLEGPSTVRTVTIITDLPIEVTQVLMNRLGQGVSQWEIIGSYTGRPHTMLMCTVHRPQVNNLKQLVAQTDPDAFVIIGDAHQALGAGFSPLK
ncbi:MAG: YitT family protein [Candidatus Promineifilaceae bacterium]